MTNVGPWARRDPLLLGEAVRFGGRRRKELSLRTDQRTRHLVAIGGSGAGKSRFARSLLEQDARCNRSYALIDAQDLVRENLALLAELSDMNESAQERIVVQPSPTPRRPHPSRLERRARPARIQITPRDRAILASLGVHRLLTSEQLHRLHFPRAQARRVRRRLRQLFDSKLVDRIAVVAQPQQGAPQFVYALNRDGAELAAEQLGTTPALPAASCPSLRFVAHHVGVCNFYVTLAEASRESDWSIDCWRHEWELKLGGDDVEKRAERVHVTDPDSRQERALTVLPDAYFTLSGRAGTLHFFYEFDRSTHPLRRWRERALAFTAYARQGRFRERFGGEEFRVLVVTRPDYRGRSRSQNILDAIQQTVGRSELFLAMTTAELSPRTVLGPQWRRPGGGEGVSPLGRLAPRRSAVRVVARSLLA